MIELIAQLAFIDLFSEPHAAGAVDQRKGHLNIAVQAPDHLQHQQLVKIRVEQAADDRVELESMVVNPLGDVSFWHVPGPGA
jgi:hypothetical protein